MYENTYIVRFEKGVVSTKFESGYYCVSTVDDIYVYRLIYEEYRPTPAIPVTICLVWATILLIRRLRNITIEDLDNPYR